MIRVSFICLLSVLLLPTSISAYDLTADWSDAQNPNGAWSYNEGANALPHVDAWDSILGGWTIDQPAWAESENGNNRIPCWFKSNGAEGFTRDFLAGDVVVHSTDTTSGVGNGDAVLTWTNPATREYSIRFQTWPGREIGRALDWTLSINGVQQASGSLSTGDQFSRQNPDGYFADDVLLQAGDVIAVRYTTTPPSGFGDFAGVRLTVEPSNSAGHWELYE